MTGSDGNWHESLRREDPPPISSDRSFALLFGAVCGSIAMFGVWEGRRSALWWLIVALIFCTLALFAAPLPGPLNRAWRWLPPQTFKVVNPIIMGAVFFAVLTPVAFLMRWAGRDPLRLSFEPEQPSYWIDRTSVGDQRTSMTDQF